MKDKKKDKILRRKRDPRFFDHVSCRILLEKYKHLQRKVDQWLVFAVIRQKMSSVDLNASEKSLVFVTIRHRKFHLYVQLSYTKISKLRKNAHLWKDTAFLHFEGKFRKCDISVKRKHTKTNENMIFSALFTNFR